VVERMVEEERIAVVDMQSGHPVARVRQPEDRAE
jgi:hypothetical protein